MTRLSSGRSKKKRAESAMSNPPPVPSSAPLPISQRTDKKKLEELLAQKFSKQIVFDDKALAAILKQKVIGQDKMADQVCDQLKRRLAQAKNTHIALEKPRGVFLLAGPPGVGKTYFCKILAQNMYEGKGKLLFIDMTQMSDSYAKSSLIGSPPNFGGGDGTLTKALEQNPEIIILLDEFEKAHPEVQKIFLTAWNDGFINDLHSSKKVSTTKAMFLLTTNAAMERLVEIEESYKDDQNGRDRAVREALKQAGYAPELLDRLDYTFVFQPLDEIGMIKLASLEIQRFAKTHGLTVAKIDSDYLVYLVAQDGAFEGGGARDLARVIDRQLGGLFIDAKNSGATLIRVSLIEDSPFVRTIEDK
jgi:ATP-dependent Clp protease ATP-binding subunit ClpA